MRAAAAELLRHRLWAHGISLEPEERGTYRLALTDGTFLRVRLLVAAAPHRRGGRGSWGLHWLLSSEDEDYVAMVDLSREALWLMPAEDFRARAQPMFGGRFHLDWLVWRLSPRSVVQEEPAFEEYLFERVLATWARPPESGGK